MEYRVALWCHSHGDPDVSARVLRNEVASVDALVRDVMQDAEVSLVSFAMVQACDAAGVSVGQCQYRCEVSLVNDVYTYQR